MMLPVFKKNDGSIASSFFGGTSPYTSFLMDDAQQLLSSNDSVFNLSSSQYYLYGQDNNGCYSDTIILSVQEPSPINITVNNVTDLICNNVPDGSISVDAIGGAQSTYINGLALTTLLNLTINQSIICW